MIPASDGCKNIVILSVDRQLRTRVIFGHLPPNYALRDTIENALDTLGEESAKAQQLQMPITSASKLASTLCNDVVFLILKACISETGSQNAEFTQLGFIRFGARDLYCSDGNCLQHLPNCQSILDFYIRPKRCGFGKLLLDQLLEHLNLKPEKLAYDRPSGSLIAFLKKHYSLNNPRWQHNHYVIFDDIFR